MIYAMAYASILLFTVYLSFKRGHKRHVVTVSIIAAVWLMNMTYVLASGDKAPVLLFAFLDLLAGFAIRFKKVFG